MLFAQKSRAALGAGFGTALGAGIGTAFGTADHNVSLWLPLGAGVGVALGAVYGALVDARRKRGSA